MDTSDSECFESADEDLNDEIEDSKESLSGINEKLKCLKVVEDNTISNSSSTISNCEIELKDKGKLTETYSEDVPIKDSVIVKSPEHVQFNESAIATSFEDSQISKNVLTKADTQIKNSTYSQHDKETRKNESCNQEALTSISTNENTQICTIKNDTVTGHPESKDLKSQSCSETAVCQTKSIQDKESSDQNLWENDGWEFEDEIDIPNSEHNVASKKDPLNVSTENMWDNSEWEELEDPQFVQKTDQLENNTNNNKQSDAVSDSWGSWGTWGVTSLLSTATQSVSTITNQVSQGLSSVLETGIGIPSAEELAKLNREEEKKVASEKIRDVADVETDIHENPAGFVFGNLGSLVSGVSNITKFVENTGTKVISGGLETLENIGKKTMEVLQEGDPGLKKKRAFLKLEQEKPILSQVLREAKAKAEEENLITQYETNEVVKKVNYEALFDDYHGLVHLEALEMLSKQCESKLKMLCDSCSGDALVDIQETMDQIKELCELPDEDEDELITLTEIKEGLKMAVSEGNLSITYEKLISCWEETDNWLDNIKTNVCSEEELHHQAIKTLAQLTALAVEQYHKAGELMLIKEHRSTADESVNLAILTSTLTSLIGIVAAKFSEKLNLLLSAKDDSSKENINNLITNVFFEASNSSSYIQDAFQLLIPVIQVGAI